jgi:predicted dehydrogenase
LWFDIAPDRLARIVCTSLGGGILYDVASYWLAIVQHMGELDVIECSVEVLRATGGRDLEIEARLRLRSGAVAELYAGYGKFRASHTTSFEGGSVRVENFLRPAVGMSMLSIIANEPNKQPKKISFASSNYYTSQLGSFLATSSEDASLAARNRAATRARAVILDQLVSALLRQPRM